jgi:pimeloyl-ACP methyl ester carboxylesterase
MYEPATKTNAIVDIVFLHGLIGNAYTTWHHSQTNVHWPSMCLKERIPDSRIISFGYDADVAGWLNQKSTNNVANHAQNMLGGLVRLRESTGTEQRKIVFVTHSLGGLVTETAIARSRHNAFEHIRQIEMHTVGIIFMGTPHFGSDAAKWATFAARSINAVKRTNINIVEVLKPDSEMLETIQRNFQSILRQRIDEHRPIEITCFYEELEMKVVGAVRDL